MTDITPITKASEASGHAWPVTAGLAIVGLAIALRVPGMIEPRFWQDEMISLSVAGGSLVETIVATVRYSAHPPAYYAQLNLWMLGGKNASFIILNSVLWSVATVAALFYLGRNIVGEKTAALAALIFAIMPMSLYFAENARMYSMICFFQVAGWWSIERLASLRNEPQREFWKILAGLSVAQLLIGFAHAIGPIFSACLGLFGLVRLLQESAPRPVIFKYLGVQTALGAILVLVLVNGVMRETQHQSPENFNIVSGMLTHVLFGPDNSALALAPVTMLIYLLVAGAVFVAPRVRMATIVLVILPMSASILTTLAVKPVLAVRPLALTLPFIALACAAALVNSHSMAKRAITKSAVTGIGILVVASFALLSLKFITQYEKPHDFRTAAADLAREVKPGDSLIIIESPTILWGLSWYLAGPESVFALSVQPPPNEKWQALFDRLGRDLTARLGLGTGQDTLMWNGIPIIMGEQGIDRTADRNRAWLAYYDAQDISAIAQKLQKSGRELTFEKSYRGVTISRYEVPD